MRVGSIKNKMTTFDATRFLLRSFRLVLVANAILPSTIEMTTPSSSGVSTIINILNIVGEGVNKVNSELDDRQSKENTVVVPDPINFNGVNMSLIVLGKFILYESVVVIIWT